MSSNTQKLSNAITPMLIVVGIMMVNLYVSLNVFGAVYGTYEMLRLVLPAEALMIIVLYYFAKKYYQWPELGFRKMEPNTLVWMLPAYIILLIGIFNIFQTVYLHHQSKEAYIKLATILSVTILVGISEELLFRGLLLQTFLKKYSVRKSIALSALGFSLFHSINLIGGMPLYGMPIQLALTFIGGFFLANVMVRIKSIYPLIIWHALWDFMTFASGTFGVELGVLAIVNISLQIILSIWLFTKNKQTLN